MEDTPSFTLYFFLNGWYRNASALSNWLAETFFDHTGLDSFHGERGCGLPRAGSGLPETGWDGFCRAAVLIRDCP